MKYQTDLARAKGLGSTKHGFGHWWMQRTSAVLLIPCGLFVLFGIAALDVTEAATVIAWLQQPFNAGVTLLFAVCASYHAALGLQVVLEDYVNGHVTQVVSQYLVKVVMIVLIMVSIYSIASILFGG